MRITFISTNPPPPSIIIYKRFSIMINDNLVCQMFAVDVGDPHRANMDRVARQSETQDVPPAQAVQRLSRV